VEYKTNVCLPFINAGIPLNKDLTEQLYQFESCFS